MVFALVGNQNSGKTTLFNRLTGSNQHTGNFPGVTVERKDGVVRGHKNCIVVDLPGIYSMSPYSSEETVSRDFILNGKPDCIINIVDASNIERNFYLTVQLLLLETPTVIALNMMDELQKSGGSIDAEKMEALLGVPVVPISASKNEGIPELIDIAIKAAKFHRLPSVSDLSSGPVHRCIYAVTHLIENQAEKIKVPAKFAAAKIIEQNDPLLEALSLNERENHALEEYILDMENRTGLDRKAAIADMRYTFIEAVCSQTVSKPNESIQHKCSVAIDKVLTNKYLAIPFFFVIIGLVFWLSFGVIGSFLSELLAEGIDVLAALAARRLERSGVSYVMRSLITDGIFAGVGAVLSFIPTISVLFFFLSLLEDSGYMARIAFVMDKPLRKIGLSGRSFVPMLVGFGCSVPAIMSTRTLSGDRDRRMTMMLIPFMSCSAKLPVYSMFSAAFFPDHAVLVMVSLYFFGIFMAAITSAVLNKTVFKGNPTPFIMELPNYRLPTPKTLFMLLWNKAKDFITRAFTVIFFASITIWLLQNFDIHFNITENSSHSILAVIGRILSPFFCPLGFSDYRISTALLTGFMAKEAIISAFAVLLDSSDLAVSLHQLFTPLNSCIFLSFTLLYTPCIAAVRVFKTEFKSRFASVYIVLFQSGIAYITSFILYRILLIFT